jgi:NAD(P)-dependent dehydrogenase (short-subunit alcohol dehydrogenase family)
VGEDAVLVGQVAVVTGAASGIGRATALSLSALGAVVVGVDRLAEPLAALVADLANGGRRALSVVLDLGEAEEVASGVARITDELGRIDILVNCAGVTGPRRSLVDSEPDDMDAVLAINLRGALLLTGRVLPVMIEGGRGGRIVNVSSASASRAMAYSVAYAASKAGIEGATRAIAGEVACHDINVNAVAPGVTATNIHGPEDDDEARRRRAGEGPTANLFGRASDPEDVAACVAFLCRPDARQITGQVIHVSAGAIV